MRSGSRTRRRLAVALAICAATAAPFVMAAPACPDSDSDGVCDASEDADLDGDLDPSTSPGPDTDGDTVPNHLDGDDDGDGIPTSAESPDPDGDGSPRDAADEDLDQQPDHLDLPSGTSIGTVAQETTISRNSGGLGVALASGENFGFSVTSVGDLDLDGVVDLAVGAPGYSGRGAVYVLFMNPDGSVRTRTRIAQGEGSFAGPLASGDQFGRGVAGLGDLDGDGIGDLAVGAPGGSTGVWILHLRRDGTVASQHRINGPGGTFGISVGRLGDLDRDGLPDIAVGAPGRDGGDGAVFVVFLNADGTVRSARETQKGSYPGSDVLGSSVSGLGDVDGDGVPDLLLGDDKDNDGGGTDTGAVWVSFLRTDGSVRVAQKISNDQGLLGDILNGDDFFGSGAAGVGDLDGDGVPDVVVGANGSDGGASGAGAVYALLLRTDGQVKQVRRIDATSGGLAGPLAAGDAFGSGVGAIGDLDEDGTIGVAVGAPGDDDGTTNSGAVHVLDFTGPPQIVVNSTADDGDANTSDGICSTGGTNSQGAPRCTLRAAIQQANVTGDDSIGFAIPTTEAGYTASPLGFRLTPATSLPAPSRRMTIDATTQPQFASVGRPVVEIRGPGPGSGHGLRLLNRTVVRGLAINGFDVGIQVPTPGGGSVLQTNHLGTDVTGTVGLGNAAQGLVVEASDVTVGGPSPSARNVVSGNGADGILVTGAGDRLVLLNNHIGTDLSGAVAVPNTQEGLNVFGPSGVEVGRPGQGNLISGNADAALRGWLTDSRIRGNLIGVAGDGTTPLGNQNQTIHLQALTSDVLVGGTSPDESNVIAHGRLEGILVDDGAARVAILGNSIVGNGLIGIDLRPGVGHTPNDAGDGDTGGNALLNHPVVRSVDETAGVLDVVFDLDTPANPAGYRVEFFTNPSGGDTAVGYGEGERFVGAVTTPPGTGLTATIPGFAGDVVTATATRITPTAELGFAETSEFSAIVTADGVADPVVIDSIQKGAVTIADGATSVDVRIDPVTPDSAFSTFTLRSAVSDPLDSAVSGRLVDATTMRFERTGSTGPVTLDWSVLDFDSGVTVQRGTVTTDPSASVTRVPIDRVNVSRSFPLLSQVSTGATFGDNDFVRSTLSTDELVLHKQAPATGNVVAWQVVSYDQSRVRAGTVSIPNGATSATATVSAFDPTSSWLVYGAVSSTGGPVRPDERLVRGRTTDSTTLTFDRFGTAGAVDVGYHLVEFLDGVRVQTPAASFAAADATSTATIDDVEPTRSVVVAGDLLYGGRSAATTSAQMSTGWTTTRLVSRTSVRARRDATGAAADSGMFVMTWPGGSPTTTVTVNSTGDAPDLDPGDGLCQTGRLSAESRDECTLRAAIQEAGATTTVDSIEFDVPATDPGLSGGVWTISPASPLPAVTSPVVIDATTQPGASSTPEIELDGSGTSGDGLVVDADDVTVRGLAIGGFPGVAIDVNAAADVVVVGNHLGLAADGSTPRPNAQGGVRAGPGTARLTIGGTTTADRNVVASNGSHGIVVDGSTSTTVLGNLVGTDVTGLLARPNVGDGISVTGASTGTTIGTPGGGNVVSANTADGISLDGSGVVRTTVRANMIGVGADGSTALGNGRHGLATRRGARDTVVGGRSAGHGNIVSSNSSIGVLVDGPAGTPSDATTIEGNQIGTDVTGTLDRGNGSFGIAASGPSVLLAIGDRDPTAANTIVHNGSDGIALSADVAARIVGNRIHDNGALGIDVAPDGPTPNQPADGVLDAPVLLAARTAEGTTTLDVRLDLPVGDHVIDYFENPGGADPSGFGEGERLIASVTVAGTGSPTTTRHVIPATTSAVTATTTSVGAAPTTSEFSNAVTPVEAADAVLLDSSARRSDLVAAGGTPTTTPDGIAGPGLVFDGVDDHLIGPALDVTSDALTLGVWVSADSVDRDQALISKRTASGEVAWELAIDAAGRATATLRLSGSPVSVTGGVLTETDWHRLDATWDGTDLVLFVDGEEVDRSPATGTLATDVTTATTIGARSDGSRRFAGVLDLVGVDHDAVTPTEIGLRYANVAGSAAARLGDTQTGAPGSWTASTDRARSGSFSLSAPETSGPGEAAWTVAVGIDEPGLVFRSMWWISQSDDLDVAAGTRAGRTPVDQLSVALVASPFRWELRRPASAGGSIDATGSTAPVVGDWFEVEMWTDQNGESRLLVDGVEVVGWTPQGDALTRGSAGLVVNRLPVGESWFVDDVRARKLVTPEPVTSLGPLHRD